MLTLTRQREEQIVITHPDGTEVTVTVVAIRGEKVRLGFDAPQNVRVDRFEVHQSRKLDRLRGTKPQ